MASSDSWSDVPDSRVPTPPLPAPPVIRPPLKSSPPSSQSDPSVVPSDITPVPPAKPVIQNTRLVYDSVEGLEDTTSDKRPFDLNRIDEVGQEKETASSEGWVSALRVVPAWLISVAIHFLGLLMLALLFLPITTNKLFDLEFTFADDLGEQLEDLSFGLEPVASDPVDEEIVSPLPLKPTEDPLAAPANTATTPDPIHSTSELSLPQIGWALKGREPGMKRALLAAYGGNQQTEAAVDMGLQWLKRNQRRDGSWSLSGPYSGGSRSENNLAATAMALLAFQGSGHTHLQGKYQKVVAKGWRFLRKLQDENGNFWKGGIQHHRLYSQGQASIAICELYGMTKDSEFRELAQRAIDYAVRIQDELGGWRYQPGSESDTSVTGWFMMALQSGRMSGLEVPAETLKAISYYLDMAAEEGGARYAYMPGNGGSLAMTAEGLLCRQYLGWRQNDRRMVLGATALAMESINWANQDVYQWYYATQMLHNMEGDLWTEWNQVMRKTIPEHQTTAGREKGSWAPSNDRWGSYGGRLYTTCMCIYMLEVYYRHLPIYTRVYDESL